MLTGILNLANLATLLRLDEEGQGMAEYALILALVSVAAILSLTSLGTDVASVFTSIAGQL